MELSNLRIRQATDADAARLHELHTNSVRTLCKSHYAPEVIDGWLAKRSPQGYLPPIKRGDIIVAEQGSMIVGFCEAASGIILAVYVDPASAKQHVGRILLNHAIQIASCGHIGPIRLEATLNAIGFYERFGFRVLEPINVQRGSVAVPCVLMQLSET